MLRAIYFYTVPHHQLLFTKKEDHSHFDSAQCPL